MTKNDARDFNQMQTRTGISEPETGETRTETGVSVPRMATVDETATIDDLDIVFDDVVEQQVLREVENTELPEAIEDILLDDGVLGDRSLSTWRWMWYVCGDMLTLNCVPEEHQQNAREAKTIMALYTTLVDDIGEKLDDKTTFWEIAKTAYPESEPDWDRDDINSDYAHSLERVWTELTDRLESAPRYDDFAEPFMFNLQQTVQSMEYTRVSDHHTALMNPEETWYFDTQGIGSFLFWTIDLMYSPDFQMDDFRAFRQVVYELQHMWRLGNWVTTWELEVHEHDFTAGIFVEAIDKDIISETDIKSVKNGEMDPERLIGRIKASGLAEKFTADWQHRRNRLYEEDFGMESLDSDEMVEMMEDFMQSHLAIEKHR